MNVWQSLKKKNLLNFNKHIIQPLVMSKHAQNNQQQWHPEERDIYRVEFGQNSLEDPGLEHYGV